MNQLLVECSEPGLVISLAEEFEYVLRHVDFERAMAFRKQLSALAEELGEEVDQAWRSFRLELPNQSGFHPLTFSSRGAPPEEPLERLASEASQRGVGTFEVGSTLLLQQSGPPPETREQYVSDLTAGIRDSCMALGVFSWPVRLPEDMADHREQLLEEHILPGLKARARSPALGRKWIKNTGERLEGALEEVNTRAEAVMAYQLGQLDPADQGSTDRIRWTAVAVRLGKHVERWYEAAEAALPYLYQKAALARLLWSDSRGLGSARSFLEARLQSYVDQAESVYTPDGVDALRLLYERTQCSPWKGLEGLLAEADGGTSPISDPEESEDQTACDDDQSASLDS